MTAQAYLSLAKEVINHDHDGVLCSDNSNSIASAVSELLADPLRCKSMGENGHQKLLNTYDWSVIVNKINAIYNSSFQTHAQRLLVNYALNNQPQ